MNKTLAWFFLSLAISFALVHILAVRLSLYWYYSWFDIIMHLWGGFLIALFVPLICSFSRVKSKPSWTLLLVILTSTLLIWEGFEYLVGLYSTETYVYDLSKDLIFGLAGGLIGYSLLKRRRIV